MFIKERLCTKIMVGDVFHAMKISFHLLQKQSESQPMNKSLIVRCDCWLNQIRRENFNFCDAYMVLGDVIV